MKLNKIIKMIAAVSLLSLPVIAAANPLTIVNGTRKAFSVSVNNHCSSVIGYVQPGQHREVSESVLNKLCGVNQTACQAEVHHTSNCSGTISAKFGFDVKTGLSGSFISMNPYKVNIVKSNNTFVLYEE